MRFMLRAMISSNSLSAFSASVMHVGLTPVQGSTPFRPFGAGMQGGQSSSPSQILPDLSKPAPTAGSTPRGSLLDLSV